MELEEARRSLGMLQHKLAAFRHGMEAISYDGMTSAPKGTSSNRAHSIPILAEEAYKLQTSDETLSFLNYLDEHKEDLTESERRQVYLLLKDLREMQKIPLDEYVAAQNLMVEADDIWHRAKETNDFALFEPYLEKIFETRKRFAGYIAPEKKPYDQLLGEFEDGLTTEICDAFFGKLRSRLVPLLRRIREVPQVDDSFLFGSFPVEDQRKLTPYLMKIMGIDFDHVGYAETEHPFTTSLGSHHDERITTHYYENYFVSSLYSVVHESGHALYDTGSRDEFAYTVLDGGVSMGIHESQSRFYENIIGRSLPYCELIYPKLCELFPSLREHTAYDFYRAVNKAEPSLIRTEADEVTYCLHIMVRYELEKKVMAGELTVHELPEAWNRLYREYLGVDVPDDTHGVLQDTHWSGGMIGYFPSYALGSAYGAQFLAKMQESVDVWKCIREGNFEPVNAWNREHIWQYGSLYKSNELLEKVLGGPFSPDCYLDYLENKMKEIYGI